jgi:NAD(P)-dependent dehydrogenase (short-subunit alcohol dehydrogenase family)
MSRYVAAHANPQGAGDSRPTAMQIVRDEDLVGKLTDKVMVITGGSAGIGVETARAFHATGAKLFLTVRDIAKGQKVVDSITAGDPTNKAEINLIKMELDSLDSIRAGAKDLLGQTHKINILVNNAGVMATPEGRTKDGFEIQFGTNHLAHFLWFQLLKQTLLQSSTQAFQSRVICVSSFGHREGPVRFDDYNFDQPSSYSGWSAYGQAKTANIYMANEIERRYSSQGLHGISLHPGGIKSNLQVHVNKEGMLDMWEVPEVKAIEKTPEQGAATSVYAALSRDWEGKGGIYLSNCAVMGPFRGKHSMDVSDDGYAPYAYDAAAEGRLWKDSLKMVGIEDGW